MKTNTELFYEFLVKEGVLFQFLPLLKKETLEQHCSKLEKHNYIWGLIKLEKFRWKASDGSVLSIPSDLDTKLNNRKIWLHYHNRWNKYYKRYGK